MKSLRVAINLVFYLYSRTHSGGDGSRFNKASFEARWLLALEACKERSSVFFKFLGAKAYFTNRQVNGCLLVDAVFNLTSLRFSNGFYNVCGHSAALRIWH